MSERDTDLFQIGILLETRLAAVSEKSTIAEAIRYGFHHWDGLVRFLDDGRIEMCECRV